MPITATTNRQIRLKRRPTGNPTVDDFELVETSVDGPADGQVLRRTIYLSLDPYMRGRLSDAPSYATPVALGAVMCGHTVSEAGGSNQPAFDNVGGSILSAVLRLLNRGARIPLCGLISEYNATSNPSGPNLRPLLVHRAMIKGFIVSDHNDRLQAFLQECAPLVASGRLKYR